MAGHFPMADRYDAGFGESSGMLTSADTPPARAGAEGAKLAMEKWKMPDLSVDDPSQLLSRQGLA
jgi:hypothetical protein